MTASDIPLQPPSLNDPRYQQPEEEDRGPRLIGRPPEGYAIDRNVTERRFAPERGGLVEGQAPTTDATIRRSQSPQYFEGDEYQMFVGMSPEQIAAIQTELLRAGIVDAEDFRPGVWDPDTADAMKDVLEHANFSGLSWDEALVELAANPRAEEDGGGAGGRRGRRGYMAPDYATLAQAAKSAIRQNLGREPEDWEVKLLADELGGGFQQQLSMQQQVDQYEQQPAGEGEGPGQTFTDVDPKARFAERFEELYRPELEAEQREEDASTNTQLLMRSITGMDRTVGA